MTFPSFTTGEVLTAADMNAVSGWLVKTQTVGTAVATIDVTGCFDSTYANYRVFYTGGTGSTSLNLQMQFLIGTTPTATNYNGGRGYINVGGAVWQINADNNATLFACGSAGTAHTLISLDVMMPNINGPTMANGFYSRIDNGQVGICFTQQNNSSQFTGFRITTSAGTVSGGTIRVYGWKN